MNSQEIYESGYAIPVYNISRTERYWRCKDKLFTTPINVETKELFELQVLEIKAMKETDYDAHLGLENAVGKPVPKYTQREEIERELNAWKAGIDAILQVLFYLGLFTALMFSLGYFWYRT